MYAYIYYSFIHLYQFGLTVFSILSNGVDLLLFVSDTQTILDLSLWSLFHLNPGYVSLVCLDHSLRNSLLSSTRYSRLILYFPLLRSWNLPFPQGTLVTFTGEWYLKTRIWVIGMVIAIDVIMLLDILNKRARKCILLCVCPSSSTNLYIYFEKPWITDFMF